MRLALLSSRFLLLSIFALFLASCGGGGTGSPLDGVTGGNGGTTDDTDTTTSSSNTSGLAMSLALLNEADGTPTSTINSVEPGRLVATLTTSGGQPVPNAIITFTVLNGSPDLTPSSGEILTNASGQASIIVGVGTSEAGAAISLQAVVADLTTSVQFSVGSANIDIGRDPDGNYSSISSATFVVGELDVDAMGGNSFSISATGTTTLRVGVIDVSGGSLFTPPLTVNFTSNCAAATLDTGVTTVNGIASSTFTAAPSCEGDVTVTASLVEISGATATGAVTVAGSTANSIEFESATPTTIAIKGTGGVGRQETSELIFQVVDNGGLPKAGETVTFALSTTLGGITLTDTSAISNAAGEVKAIVSSGTVPTPVQVIATLTLDGGAEVSTVSDTLVISTGLPDQDSFTVSASVLNPGGRDINGVETTITIQAADAFNNPVPDGTPISVTTEYGAVDPSCTTSGGSCTVIWRSQNPKVPSIASTGTVRTINNTACDYDEGALPDTTGRPCTNSQSFPLGQVYAGRNTIMAYALGDETFIDTNGNGFYDWVDANGNGSYDVGEEEPWVDLPEAFLDKNEDGVFGNSGAVFDNNGDGACTSDDGRDQCSGWLPGGAEETFIDLDGDGMYDGDADGDTANGSVGNGIYNGSLCIASSEALGICSPDPINVRDEVVILMSASTPVVDVRAADGGILAGAVDATAGAVVLIYISDFQNGFLAAGSVITIEADNCDFPGDGTYTVGNTSAPGFTIIPLALTEDDTTTSTSGPVRITVESRISSGSGAAAATTTVEGGATFTCIDAS